MKRKNVKELKAAFIGRGYEIKRLKKKIRLIESSHKIVLSDYHTLVNELMDELNHTKMALEKSKKKRWYQFVKVRNI